MTDLFGDDPDPPRKGGEGYLAHLAGLPYPDGYEFWALAHGDRAGPHAEYVWLSFAGRWHRHLIDIRTGEIIAAVPDTHPAGLPSPVEP